MHHRSLALVPAALVALVTLGAGGCSSGATRNDVISHVCQHYASHLTGGWCGNPALPADEVARVSPRWARQCEGFLGMPRTTLTAVALDECLTLLEAGACWSANLPPSCLTAGTLPGGSTCNQAGFQCQSGLCAQSAIGSASPCGSCLPVVAIGDLCDPAGLSNLCVLGSACLLSASAGGNVCTQVTLGAKGTTCGQDTDCNTGLICDLASSTCAVPPGSGGFCTGLFSCAYPLVCGVGDTCQLPGAAGAPCLVDEHCQKGLGCSNQTATCGTVTWQAPGQPCDQDLSRCLVGACPAALGPTCPVVLADGAACDPTDAAHICDVTAICFAGTCQVETTVACE